MRGFHALFACSATHSVLMVEIVLIEPRFSVGCFGMGREAQ